MALFAYGGVHAFDPKASPFVVGLFLVLAGVAVVNLKRIDTPYLIGVLAVAYSLMLNLDIWRAGLGRLLLIGAALGVLVLAKSITLTELRHGLTWAGWLWPLAALLGPGDNTNVLAVWPLAFLLASNSTAQKWLYGAALLWLGSRGAIIGAAVGLMIATGRRPDWRLGAAALGAGLALIAWRPTTALYRLGYWAGALRGWASSPLWGVGPGGVGARGLVDQPGAVGNQIHSHNIIITTGAELGLIGLGVLLWLGWHMWRALASDWQRAIVAALGAWSLVDEPLFWPGPLLLLALVVGCIPAQPATRPPN